MKFRAMSDNTVFTFGDKHTIIGTISRPRKTQNESFQEAVIIVGMGIGEAKIARGLNRLGFLAMQVRLIPDTEEFRNVARQRAVYDESGVERMQEAMNYLNQEIGIRQFHLMGTCATANLAVNTALIDSRVVGLVLVNMHFTEHLTYRVRLKKRLFSWSKWKRLLNGKANYTWHKQNLANIAKGASRSEVASQWQWRKDIMLPVNIEEAVEALTRKAVRILVIYARSEPDLLYFKKTCGKVLRRLGSGDRLALKVIERDFHIFSKDDLAADSVNDIVKDWFKNNAIPALPGPLGGASSPVPASTHRSLSGPS
jgi:hypothetical protein